MEKKTVDKLIKTILILNIIAFMLTILLMIIESETILLLLGLMIWTIPIMSFIALLLMNKKGEE